MLRFLATALLAVTFFHVALAQQIALPPHTVEGYLPNGLHYMIKANDLPRHTVEFRLVMHVGSLQETEQQLGGAHFLEHMATKGMKKFPGRSMVDYFERQGMKYGRDINAFTGFDRTIYWFTVPTYGDASRAMDTTLMVVNGILSELTFDEERTRKERGVILEELRGYDTHDPFYSLKIGCGLHANRIPLGDEEDIQRIDRRRLIDFYRKWYAPQFATLVVVGDIDAYRMEQGIRRYMGNIPRRGKRRLKPTPLIYKKGMQLMELRDTMDSQSKLELMIPHPCTATATLTDAVEHERGQMLRQALSTRLQMAHVPCHVTDQWYLADLSHFTFNYNGVNKDSLQNYIARTANELLYLASHGPEEEELKELIQWGKEHVHCHTTNALSSVWCDNFIDQVIVGDRRIYTEAEAEQVRQGVAQTTSADMQRLASQLLMAMQQHLLVAYTNHEGEPGKMDEADVQTAWQRGDATRACAYSIPRNKRRNEEELHCPVPQVLLQSHPYDEKEVVESWHVYSDLGISEVRLKNGVRLLFRPTLDEERKVQLMALGRGGTSSLDDDDCYQLKDAVAYMDMGGIEGIGADTLMAVMSMGEIGMNVGLEDDWHQLMASSDEAAAQVMMNLVYEKMHHPRKCYEDFEEARQSEINDWGKETLLMRLMRGDADRLMQNCIDSVVGNVRTRRPMQCDDLMAMDLDRMEKYYRRLYTNPEGLTIILTGNYDRPTVEQAAIGTFARMQRPDSVLSVCDEPVQPMRTYTRQFDNNMPSQTVYNYLFAGNYDPSLRQTLTFKLMRDLLQARLLSVLRERENIVYSPYSDLYYRGLPQRTYYFWLNIAVKNENAERMQKLLRGIIGDLQEHPVNTAELEKLKRSFVVTRRQQLSDVAPTEWRNAIAGLLKNGESLRDFDHYEDVLSSITPADVQTAFRNYIDFDHCILMYKAK